VKGIEDVRRRKREKREKEIEVHIIYINNVPRLDYRRFPSQQGVRKFYRTALYLAPSLFKFWRAGADVECHDERDGHKISKIYNTRELLYSIAASFENMKSIVLAEHFAAVPLWIWSIHKKVRAHLAIVTINYQMKCTSKMCFHIRGDNVIK